MPFQKRRKRTGGRKKGTPNKISGALKDMILTALDNAGGQQYLQKQANENPTAFLTLVGKVLPMTIAGDSQNPVTLQVITGIPRAPGD